MNISNERLTVKAGRLALLAAFLWGGMNVSIKIALTGVPPLALAAFRFIIGAFIVYIWTVLIRIPLKLEEGEKRGLLGLTLLFVAQIGLVNMGTDFTLASRSTILFSIHPFSTALFAHLFLPGDRLSYLKITGITLSFTGVVLIFIESLALKELNYLAGDLMVLASGALLGFRIVYIKRLTQRMHPGKILLWQAFFSIPIFLLLSILFEGGFAYRFTPDVIASVLYQGVVIAGFCFILMTLLLRRHKASRLGVFQLVSPVFGVLFSNALLGEGISHGLIISLLLVGAGIVIVNYED